MHNQVVKLSLFLNYFVLAILLNSVGIVIFQVQNSYHVSESSASLLEAFKDLSIAITSFLVASFITRFGLKRAMLLALATIGVACLFMPQVPEFWMAKLLFAVVGVSFALVKISVFSCVGLVTSNQREHASLMNFLESFFMVGVLSGYFLFSAFVDDANPESIGWLAVYYPLAGLIAFAFALLLFTSLDETAAKKTNSGSAMSEFRDMLGLCFKPLVYVFIICAFLYVLIEQSIMTWLPTFNSNELNMSASLSIQMTSILAASAALGRFSAGFALKRMDWYLLLVICLLAAAVLVVAVLPLTSLVGGDQVSRWADAPLAAYVFPLIGLCLAPVYPAINSVILSALPKSQHASMAGLIVVFSALGGTIGSIITGTLFEVFDGKTAFYFSLVPLAAILASLHQFKRQTDAINRAVPAMHKGSL